MAMTTASRKVATRRIRRIPPGDGARRWLGSNLFADVILCLLHQGTLLHDGPDDMVSGGREMIGSLFSGPKWEALVVEPPGRHALAGVA